jgi:predicted dienelactone hydrolase
MVSHGTGGAADDLGWLAEALRDAGFLVAGVDHHGNTSAEPYRAEGFARMWERPRDVSLVIDWLVARGDVDADRVGAAGFSLGGYTVAALLGARIDAGMLRAIIAGHIPVEGPPEFPDVLEKFAEGRSPAELDAIADDSARSVRDARVRAGFLMAPAIAELLDAASLAGIENPVRIVWGDADDNMPPETNAATYLAAMPNATGHSVGQTVGHYEFHGANAPGAEVRAGVAAEAVAFFRDRLAVGDLSP